EQRLAGDPGGAAQAGRVVEHDDRALRPRVRRRQVGSDLGERLGEGQRQRGRDRGAQQEQQDLAQPAPRRDLALGAQQELHGREPDRVRAPLADAVDQPGQQRRREAEQQGWSEEAHRVVYLRARWRPNRNVRRRLAGGTSVDANRYSTRASRQARRQRSRSASDSRRNDAARSRGSQSRRRSSSGSMASKWVKSSKGSSTS